MTDFPCGAPLIYKRRPVATIERNQTPIHTYGRSCHHPKVTLPGQSKAFSTTIHHQSTKVGVGFYATRRPNVGKNCPRDRCRAARCAMLFVQRANSPAEPQGAHGPIGGRGFPRQAPRWDFMRIEACGCTKVICCAL